jgi:hypothetical protein
MKRTSLAIAFALLASAAYAANDHYRNNAGEQDQHQPQLGDAGASYRVASSDPYRPNAGESTDNNVVQYQVG